MYFCTMKHFLLLTAMCILCQYSITAQMVMHDTICSEEIKSVTLYRNGIDQEPPIITLGSDERLVLTFDLLGDEPSLFRYRLQHCNAQWQIDDLESYEYMTGFEEGYIDNYQSSMNTLQHYYNYHATLPAEGMQLLLSGNYLLSVYMEDNADSIVLRRRIWVSEEVVRCRIENTRPTSGMGIHENQEVNVYIDSRDDLTFGDYLPFSFSPTYMMVHLQQNGRHDNSRWLPFGGYSNGTLCYRWKEENVFAGGNSYRYFDASNLHATMYNIQRVEEYGGELFAILRPDEVRSGRQYEHRESLMGGMKSNVWDRHDPQTEADYAWVNFALPMERPYLNGSIHISGELTGWHLDDNSRMEWNKEYKAYTKRLLLKQGYYSYQLLFLPAGEHAGLTATIEGDHYETPNRYTAYTYYHGPGDRYDRLLNVTRH